VGTAIELDMLGKRKAGVMTFGKQTRRWIPRWWIA
jgi:hypothetical protein